MNKSFRRILNLIRRTGDRMVVTDPEGEDAFVVMDLDQYEALLDLDSELMDEFMGGEDDDWGGPSTEPPEPVGPKPSGGTAPTPPQDIWDAMAPAGSEAETWNYENLDEQERAEFERAFHDAATARQSSESAVKPAEEPKKDPEPALEAKAEETPKKDDDFGEEQFYLEPIE